ncbi:MAG TPA: hypothetical protein VM510_05245 [Caulifigura sp.]|nr:hypothetical protein [Caulifigura sp.]
MLRANIVRIDGSLLIEDAEIQAQRARRGSGDGALWRGYFKTPSPKLCPTMGETIRLQMNGDGSAEAIVVEVAGSLVHFRARGTMPPRTG